MKHWSILLVALFATVFAENSCDRKGQKFAIYGSCSEYLECTDKGKLQANICPKHQSFDENLQKCRNEWEVNCQNAPKSLKKGEKVEVPGDCSSYFELTSEGLVIKKCDNGNRFDKETSSCRISNKVDCQSHSDCSNGMLAPVSSDPQSYKECVEGKYVKQICPKGSVFDTKLAKCVSSNKSYTPSYCKTGIKKQVEESCTNYMECEQGVWHKKKCSLGENFNPQKNECQQSYPCSKGTDSFGKETCVIGTKKFDETDCKNYFECKDGKYVSEKCGFLKYFNRETLQCVYSLRCPVPSEKTTINPTSTRTQHKSTPSFPMKSTKHHSVYPSASTNHISVTPSPSTKHQSVTPNLSTKHQSVTPTVATKHQSVTPAVSTKHPSVTPTLSTKYQPVTTTISSKQQSVTPTHFTIHHSVTPSGLTKITTNVPSSSIQTTEPPKYCNPGTLKAIPGKCKQHFVCTKEFKWVLDSCMTCKNFDPKNRKCVWTWNYPCQEEKPTTISTPAIGAQTSDASMTNNKLPSTCKEGEKKVFPSDCKKYYECKGGQYITKACSYAQKFDKNKLECRIRFWATCA